MEIDAGGASDVGKGYRTRGCSFVAGEFFGPGRCWAWDSDPSRQIRNTVVMNVLQEVEAALCALTDNKNSAATGRERCVTRGRRLCETGNATAVSNAILLKMSNDIHQNARLQRFSRERGNDPRRSF